MKWFEKSLFRWKFLCFLLLILCGGCIKELNFELGKQEDLLVVFGTLSDQPGRHIFRVTRTNAFERQVDSRPIEGAILLVQDSKGKQYPFVALEAGTYLLKDTLFRASAGEQYQLDLKLPDGGHYRSDVETMPNAVRMDSVYPGIVVKDFDQSLQIFADVKIPADPNGVYLRWEVSRVWRRTSIDFATLFQDYFRFKPPVVCYMTLDPEPNAIRLFGAKRRDAFSLRQQEIARIEADEKFFERNAFEVTQYRISSKAHEYWNKINLVGNPQGTIFDVPPATIRGNIYNVDKPQERILGYFEVAAVDSAYTYTDRGIFRYTINNPCLVDYTKPAWEATYGYHPECAFCVNIEGHSTKVPKFW
jgi:hypothetical protein